MQARWRVIGSLLVLMLAFSMLPTLAMGAPTITQGVQGVVKDAVTNQPIPFPLMTVNVDGGGAVNFTGEYDGTYSYATAVSSNVYVQADANDRLDFAVSPVVVTTATVTTVDFALERRPDFSQPVYRFFNMKGGVHFYTADDAEFISVYKNLGAVFKYDGIGYWIAVGPNVAPGVESVGWINHNTMPLYRFLNTKTGVHFYTTDEAERANVTANQADRYRFEGVAYNVCNDSAWGLPVFRFYNPTRDAHFYTLNESEIFGPFKLSRYYHLEGTGFYTGGWELVGATGN